MSLPDTGRWPVIVYGTAASLVYGFIYWLSIGLSFCTVQSLLPGRRWPAGPKEGIQVCFSGPVPYRKYSTLYPPVCELGYFPKRGRLFLRRTNCIPLNKHTGHPLKDTRHIVFMLPDWIRGILIQLSFPKKRLKTDQSSFRENRESRSYQDCPVFVLWLQASCPLLHGQNPLWCNIGHRYRSH